MLYTYICVDNLSCARARARECARVVLRHPRLIFLTVHKCFPLTFVCLTHLQIFTDVIYLRYKQLIENVSRL